MLSKLIKHEFRATGRIMGPLFLIVLALSLGAKASMSFLLGRDSFIPNMLGGLLMFAFVAGMIALGIMSVVVMVNRFRSNLLGDEGYVMFTLPVSSHQLVWSKIIVSSVWFIAVTVVIIIACMICFLTVGDLTQIFGSDFLRELGNAIRYAVEEYGLNVPVMVLEFIAVCLLSCAVACVEFYAALATGYGFARHKMALSVLFFFGYQFAMQFAGGLIINLLNETDFFEFDNWMFNQMSWMNAFHLMMGIFIVMLLVMGAIYYAITAVMLKKRLNLE